MFLCTGLSFIIVFLYALQFTNKLAEKELSDEHTTLYQFFSTYLKRSRQCYHQELKRKAFAQRPEINVELGD